MATAVIDANVLIGLLDDQDKWHATTIAIRDELNKSKAELVYFDCVINETVSVLARRTHEQGRPEQLDALLNQLDHLIPASDIAWSSGEIKRLYPEILTVVHNSAGRLNFHDARQPEVAR